MCNFVKTIMTGLLVLFLTGAPASYADKVSRDQIKGLDEQVQDIKSDVLSIAAELNQLEEKLLYPSHTQVALFVSLADGETFRLDSVDIRLAGKSVSHHLYTFKELESLRKGGVQRIYTGNIPTGTHEMQVDLKGKTSGGNDLNRTSRFNVSKDVGPAFVEIVLAKKGIVFKER